MKNPWNIIQHRDNLQFSSSLKNYLMQHVSPGESIVVGVSGGSDSMFLSCLLYAFFIEQKYDLNKLIFIHLNHGVRHESIQEAEYIKQRFLGTNLIYIERKQTQKASENELRKRRYQIFLDIMNKYNAHKLILGHHFDDRVETSLLNMMRGCGVDGYMSIKPVESHHLLDGKMVIRPLLSLRKAEIVDGCQNMQIPYVEDLTNQDSRVSQRNYLRNKILPKLFAQEGFEQLFKTRYKRYDSQSIEILLRPIKTSPFRHAKSAYCLEKKRTECNTQDVLRILKKLHASAGVTRKTLHVFSDFIKTGTKGRKSIQGVIIMIAHNNVYFFVAPPRFREKTIDNQEQIDTLGNIKRYPQKEDICKGKTRNKYCITQKIPIFWRNFVTVIAQDHKIISREKSELNDVL